jgi:glycosyltransferase involved in cell wall biosynthesis
MIEVKLLIVIPTLGRNPLLSRTVESARSVGIAATQIVIVCPAAVSEDLRRRFPDVEVVEESTGGLYGAINQGVVAAGSGWTHFTYINDDDFLAPDFGPEFAAVAGGSGCDFFWGACRYRKLDSGASGLFPLESRARRLWPLFRAGVVAIPQQGTVVSEDLWQRCGPFDTTFKLNADMDFILRASLHAEAPACTPKVVSEFSISPDQLSQNQELVREENTRILRKFADVHVGVLYRLYCLVGFRVRNLPVYLSRLRAERRVRGPYAT